VATGVVEMVNWDSGLFKFTPVWGLTFLTTVNIVIYIDRSVVGVSITQTVVHDLTSYKHGMGLSYQEAGALGSIFMLGYALSSPILAVSAQYIHPLFLMGTGLFVWSGATMMAGLSVDYPMLLIARIFTGVGEASFVCLAPPYIIDVAPPAKRTVSFTQMWLGIFYSAMIIGAALGFGYGTIVSQALGSWRWPFIIESLAMLPFILTCLVAYKDPVFRPKKLGGDDSEKANLWTQVKQLFNLRIFMLISLGYGGYAFTVGGLTFWAPDYQESFYGVNATTASLVLGGITVIAGFSGTMVGSVFTDRRLRPLQKSRDEGEISELEMLRIRTERTTGIMWLTLGAAASVALVGAIIPVYAVYLISLAISEFCIFL